MVPKYSQTGSLVVLKIREDPSDFHDFLHEINRDDPIISKISALMENHHERMNELMNESSQLDANLHTSTVAIVLSTVYKKGSAGRHLDLDKAR